MGNTVAPCMCRTDASTAAATTRGRRRPKSFVTEVPAAAAPDAAPPRRLTVTPRKHQRDDVELKQQQQQQDENEITTRAGPERSRARARAGGVSWAGGRIGANDDDDAVGKQDSSAAAVVTVKIVLKRKDAEALVARLNAQSARERKARMDELKGELFRAGDCGGVGRGGASPTRSPSRDAWKPSLAPIKEN